MAKLLVVGRMFFFEKKNQKTFANLASASPDMLSPD
jgi:hypothetical protein